MANEEFKLEPYPANDFKLEPLSADGHTVDEKDPLKLEPHNTKLDEYDAETLRLLEEAEHDDKNPRRP